MCLKHMDDNPTSAFYLHLKIFLSIKTLDVNQKLNVFLIHRTNEMVFIFY